MSAGPAEEWFESRDACFYSPNLLFTCFQPGRDGSSVSVSFELGGGVKRCEEGAVLRRARPPAFDVEVRLSGQYNHQRLNGVGPSGEGATVVPPGAFGVWRRPPHPWEEKFEGFSRDVPPAPP